MARIARANRFLVAMSDQDDAVLAAEIATDRAQLVVGGLRRARRAARPVRGRDEEVPEPGPGKDLVDEPVRGAGVAGRDQLFGPNAVLDAREVIGDRVDGGATEAHRPELVEVVDER